MTQVGGQERNREAKATQNREWALGVWPLNAVGGRKIYSSPRKSGYESYNRGEIRQEKDVTKGSPRKSGYISENRGK